jgi:hypothetical protein
VKAAIAAPIQDIPECNRPQQISAVIIDLGSKLIIKVQKGT